MGTSKRDDYDEADLEVHGQQDHAAGPTTG